MSKRYSPSSSSGELTWWKPKNGTNTIRIVKSPNNKEAWIEVFNHWKVGSSRRPLLCTADDKRDCFVCDKCFELQEEAKTTKSEKDAQSLSDKAYEMRAQSRFAICMIDLNNVAAGIQGWDAPTTVVKKLTAFMINSEWGDLFSIEEGRNIDIAYDSSAEGTDMYSVMASPKQSPVPEECKEAAKNPPDLYKSKYTMSYEEQKNTYLGAAQASNTAPPPDTSEAPAPVPVDKTTPPATVPPGAPTGGVNLRS